MPLTIRLREVFEDPQLTPEQQTEVLAKLNEIFTERTVNPYTGRPIPRYTERVNDVCDSKIMLRDEYGVTLDSITVSQSEHAEKIYQEIGTPSERAALREEAHGMVDRVLNDTDLNPKQRKELLEDAVRSGSQGSRTEWDTCSHIAGDYVERYYPDFYDEYGITREQYFGVYKDAYLDRAQEYAEVLEDDLQTGTIPHNASNLARGIFYDYMRAAQYELLARGESLSDASHVGGVYERKDPYSIMNRNLGLDNVHGAREQFMLEDGIDGESLVSFFANEHLEKVRRLIHQAENPQNEMLISERDENRVRIHGLIKEELAGVNLTADSPLVSKAGLTEPINNLLREPSWAERHLPVWGFRMNIAR